MKSDEEMQVLLQKRVDVLDLEVAANSATAPPLDDPSALEAMKLGVCLQGAIFELLNLAKHLGLKVEYHNPPPDDPDEDRLYPSSAIYEYAKGKAHG